MRPHIRMPIAPEHLAAYLIAEYAVFADEPFIFRIGERSADSHGEVLPSLARLLGARMGHEASL